MRCRACDTLLTDNEATSKDLETGEYLDLCTLCKREHYYVKKVYIENNLDTPKKPVVY